MLLYSIASDPALAKTLPIAERAIRAAARGTIELLGAEATARALTVEGGAEEREQTVIDARVIIGRAEDKFRELDDEESLALLAKATARLSGVHQEPGAIELLSRAHLLAGAIFLARGRTEAARQRLQRALDLDPELAPPRDRFAPEVLAELAAVRSASAVRPAGRLVVTTPSLTAEVFLDGKCLGATPLELDTVPAGNHLLRISAPGRQSQIETIQIAPAEDRVLEPKLSPDPEIETIARIPDRARRGEDLTAALALLARRGSAKRVLLASIALGESLTRSGTATIGVDLSLLAGGTAYAPSLEQANLQTAIARVLACEETVAHQHDRAPFILGARDPLPSRPEPVKPPDPFWNKPWFWAAAAIATIGLSGALVIARTSGGPPEAVEVHLIPRP